MIRSIWKKHFFYQISSVVFLFLAISWALFALIDYTNRSAAFHSYHFSFQEIGLYYLFLFLQKIEILLPFAILIGSIKTLVSLNTKNELLALLAAGFSLRYLMRPLLLFIFLMITAVYINFEWGYPYAMRQIHLLEDSHFQEKKDDKQPIKQALLEDGSLLLFHHFNTADLQFNEAYWIKSIDSIYRIRKFHPYALPPYGEQVDHFERNAKGELLLDPTTQNVLSQIKINPEDLIQQIFEPKEQPLSNLFEMLGNSKYTKDRKALITTALLHKLTLPWLCLIVFLLPAPFCLKFTRHLNAFLIYILSTFTLVAFYLILNALTTLSNYQVSSPWLAILIPYAILGIISAYQYKRLDTK